jgi:hypothetical protein
LVICVVSDFLGGIIGWSVNVSGFFLLAALIRVAGSGSLGCTLIVYWGGGRDPYLELD